MNFIKAENVKTLGESVNGEKTNVFIEKFNEVIKKGNEKQDGVFSINTFFDKFNKLNDNEFDYLMGLAMQQGWILTRFDDEYNTVTYKMEKR